MHENLFNQLTLITIRKNVIKIFATSSDHLYYAQGDIWENGKFIRNEINKRFMQKALKHHCWISYSPIKKYLKIWDLKFFP